MGGPVFDALRGDGSEAQKDRGCRFAGRRPGRCGVGRSATAGREGGAMGDRNRPVAGAFAVGMQLFNGRESGQRGRGHGADSGAVFRMAKVCRRAVRSLPAVGSLGRNRTGCGQAEKGQQTSLRPVSAGGRSAGRTVGLLKGREGYVIVEAAFLLPWASILILLLVFLCSYLYQGCFLTQAAYVAAFRGSRYPERGEAYVESQLEELLEGEALRFEAEERTIRIGLADVRVSLRRNTPLQSIGIRPLTASWDIPVRDPVSYIRGLRKLSETGETDE